jgi:drug/metabolite transporter (DMT)-like permease
LLFPLSAIMPIGELAALATSLCWSFTSTFFTLAGRLVGSVVVNRVRLVLAIGFLVGAHVLFGLPLPFHAERERWLWLGLSGILGLALGDAFLFQAFVWIGPRLSMLLLSLAPVLATIIAWVFLGERLTGRQLIGIAVTLTGVTAVVLERTGSRPTTTASRQRLWGVLSGLAAALGQALGLITAKKGLAGHFPPLSGTLMRMVVAAAVMWGAAILMGQARATWQRVVAHPQVIRYLVGGAFFGPFLGVTLSLVAVQATAVGIASTLTALPPVFLLPIGRLVFKERIGLVAVVGTLVAVAGVGLLALR